MLVREFGPVATELVGKFPRLCLVEERLEQVLDLYRQHRDKAAALMRNYHEPGHLLVLDRHKIGAAFMLAILEAEPLQLCDDQKPQCEGEHLANAVTAFRTAVRIIVGFARHQARKEGNQQMLARWNAPLTYPQPRMGVLGDFRHHAYRAIHHAHSQGALNLPVVAHWLFVIEQYNNLAQR